MIDRSIVRRLLLSAATGLALAVAGVSAPIVAGSLTPAMAQSTDDFNAALDAYGHWVRHSSYGEVWVPDGVPRDWRPYEYGHWVYTDDWGWYWVSDDQEADWGWVTYHYGRWAHDPRLGWFWVPGDEWAPAWVDWRYGGDDIGWAPMPPDDQVDAYDADADYWVFVPLRYIGEPELRRHYVPRDRRTILMRDTGIINRPVHIEGRRVWVNPGLAPGFIAGRTHVTLHAYNVRPRVFGATAGVQGAVTVRRDELHKKGDIRRVAPVTIQRTTTAIAPTANVPPPKPLGKGERGQLGSHPPRAAQGGVVPPPPQGQPPQGQPKIGPAGQPPKTGPAVIQHPGPAQKPSVAPPPSPPKGPIPEQHEQRRVVTPPPGGGARPSGGGAPPKPPVVHPARPPVAPPPHQPTPPPVVHAPPPPSAVRPPPAVHAPPPPPAPAAHAPPPPAAHAPPPPAAGRAPGPPPKAPPPKGPPPKPGEKPPETPK
jgi:hypothetical protein